MFLLLAIFLYLRSLLVPRFALATEILVLRQQLIVLNRTVKRPRLRRRDRRFWVLLSKLWKDWREALVIVKPETVIKWHREGFRLYWRWKSKAHNPGLPKIDAEIRALISRMSRENPLGAHLGFRPNSDFLALIRPDHLNYEVGRLHHQYQLTA